MNRKLLLLLSVLLLGGCMRKVPYQQPASPVPPAWPHNEPSRPEGDSAPKAAELPWQTFFTDDGLRKVIETALANNRDLRMAALHIERAQALYRIQRAQQFPTVNATASGSLYRLPKNSSIGGFDVSQAVTVQQYTVNLGASSWEVDLFGRIRNLKSAALEQYLATEQARTATQMALVANVASSYLALAADRKSLQLAQATFDAQQSTYELIRQTRDAGVATDLDLQQAQSQVESARVDIARYTGQVTLDENALDLLVGSPVASTLQAPELSSAGAVKDIATQLPSEVLLRRPDILAAEHQLRAAYANIGAARAAYFPRIALTAGTGLMSSDLSKLFNSTAGTWNFAPQVAIPLFDYGTRKANVKVAEVDRDLAVAEYEKAIQAAFREVSDSLSQRTRLMEQQQAQQALVDTLEQTYRLSEARYKAGLDSYLSVLVAQRALYGGQQGLVGLRLARLGNLVTLYKALGGGA
ncbi:efflux transporter outer membrane subunit [uncultured Paludibaculum sp.]|uniref:efflux transporter outer membrane subunit n=1 Tax=uncultured Paludibaculum sp. TaxID=1765020 RepID=UPI002AAB24E9|nr:efflux transporter outer membrane subunit [uncultured Paludibaculum sp.]